jgi:shikimate dehydrogenase
MSAAVNGAARAVASGGIPILAVAGRPVLHSKSPLVFRELFRASGAEAAYTRVAAGSAAEAISLFRSLEMTGMNLTAPFKEEAAAILGESRVDRLSEDARRLGAVNSLVMLDGGGIRGENTDPQGVLGALRARGVELAGRRCLVLGAGGAGKAAAFALVSAGAEVTVANRTRFRADDAAALLGCASASLEDLPELARGAEVIVSTIASDVLPDPESWFPRASPDTAASGPAGGCVAVLDADYKKGALARLASARGIPAATGVDWLISQALPSYRLFMGEEAAGGGSGLRDSLAALLAGAPPAYSRGRKIALVGLMGAGKTMAGRALAARLGLPFADNDAEIEAEASATIAEIFSSEGESGFRAREARALDRITSTPGAAVVSTGGGAPTAAPCAAMLAERCLAVWLYVTPETAAARASRSPGGVSARPLLAGGNPAGRLAALEAERRGAYAACAELLVSTEGRSFGEAAEVIHDEIGLLS